MISTAATITVSMIATAMRMRRSLVPNCSPADMKVPVRYCCYPGGSCGAARARRHLPPRINPYGTEVPFKGLAGPSSPEGSAGGDSGKETADSGGRGIYA